MRKAFLFSVFAIALGFSVATLPSAASAQISVGISVRIGPPALPVYVQPICPGDNYIWAPGYWAYGPDGYYWVPGTWVLAPEPGLLWTPGWWGFAGGVYLWHPGYWGRHVGFYGGIDYGHGYFGDGYAGGEWRGDHFYYNRAVSRVNINIIHNSYENRNYRRVTRSREAYNGGPHGVDARPTPEQQRWDGERHIQRTSEQDRHDMQARNDRSLHYSDNHGRPPVAATQRPGQFSGPGVVRPRGRPNNQFHPPTNQNRARGNNQVQPNNRPNNRGQQNRNFAPPQNETRPGENRQAQPNNRPNNRGQQNRNVAPPRNEQRGNRPQAQPRQQAPRGNQARPHNEQPRGNQRGKRGNGGGDQGGHGQDNGHH
ncbi:MAG TPA: hypothetical protein VNK23_06475 [Candidatus Dormibacteraeota bacterium]|nr:hypothetical protein [Candidatus Dormibacteraeota bacterium]